MRPVFRTSCARRVAAVSTVALLATVAAACGGSSTKSGGAPSSTGTTAPSSAARASTTTPATSAPARDVCGNAGAPPARYASVVVFSFENRTWDGVGGGGFGRSMPYLHALGEKCSWFRDWTEADTKQSSLTQYVAQVTGAPQPGTVDDCSPSARCSTTADNIFRQARRAGLQAVNFVEGANRTCSAHGNAAKHVPAMYLRGDDDTAHCDEQVRPLSELDVDALPAFAFVTPTLCNDGHDCGNETVDRWAAAHVQPILDSHAYRAGKVAVFVWYDEDHPVPNLWIAPTANPGPVDRPGAGYAGTLAAWESMLGLPCLANACGAAGMRAAAHA
jgi:hypothetical protein